MPHSTDPVSNNKQTIKTIMKNLLKNKTSGNPLWISLPLAVLTGLVLTSGAARASIA